MANCVPSFKRFFHWNMPKRDWSSVAVDTSEARSFYPSDQSHRPAFGRWRDAETEREIGRLTTKEESAVKSPAAAVRSTTREGGRCWRKTSSRPIEYLGVREICSIVQRSLQTHIWTKCACHNAGFDQCCIKVSLRLVTYQHVAPPS